MRIISIILSLIALIGSAYAYDRTSKVIKKLDEMDEMDEAIFQWMKEDFNSKVENKDE